MTWARNGQKRVVWRCVSRLEFGTKYCHNSPTLDEEKLHSAILATLNTCANSQRAVEETILEFFGIAKSGQERDGLSLLALRDRLSALTAQQQLLLDKVLEDMDNPNLNVQLKTLAEEKQDILERITALQQDEAHRANQESRMAELRERLNAGTAQFKEYDDALTRKFVEKITVVDAETIRIRFRDCGIELDEKLC